MLLAHTRCVARPRRATSHWLPVAPPGYAVPGHGKGITLLQRLPVADAPVKQLRRDDVICALQQEKQRTKALTVTLKALHRQALKARYFHRLLVVASESDISKCAPKRSNMQACETSTSVPGTCLSDAAVAHACPYPQCVSRVLQCARVRNLLNLSPTLQTPLLPAAAFCSC